MQPGTGKIFINDVGGAAFEEINLGAAGANYGWPATEGPTSDSRFSSPVHAFDHSLGPGGCAITAGVFYNPTTVQFPSSYLGKYFYVGCNGIYVLDTSSMTATRFTTSGGVDLVVGPDGEHHLHRHVQQHQPDVRHHQQRYRHRARHQPHGRRKPLAGDDQ